MRKNRHLNAMARAGAACGCIALCLAMGACGPDNADREQDKDLPPQLRVNTDPPGAVVFCDGVMKDAAPVTISDLSAGEHLLAVRKDGYDEERRTVSLTAGQRSLEEIRLNPILGLVIVHSEPDGAAVQVNGAQRGKTPLLISDLPAARHRVRLSLPGYTPIEVDLNVKGRTPLKIRESLNSDSATLVINSEPPGATITLNGIQKGKTPVTLDRVPGGEYTLELSLEGHGPYSDKIKLSPGEKSELTVSLKPVPATLKVVSIPNKARIYLDDQFRGEAPVTVENIAPGQHRIRAELPGHETMFRTVELQCAQSLTEEFRLDSTGGSVEITTDPPGVRVLLDGKEIGVTAPKEDPKDTVSTPCRAELVPIGGHEIELVLKRFRKEKFVIEVQKNAEAKRHVKLTRQFMPDYEVVTRDGITVRGALVYVDSQGNIKLEVAEGVFRTVAKDQVRYHRPLPE